MQTRAQDTEPLQTTDSLPVQIPTGECRCRDRNLAQRLLASSSRDHDLIGIRVSRGGKRGLGTGELHNRGQLHERGYDTGVHFFR